MFGTIAAGHKIARGHLAKVGVAGSNPVVRSTMSVYPERPPTPRELDEIAKAKRPPQGTFLVVAGCIGLVVILALIVWSLAT